MNGFVTFSNIARANEFISRMDVLLGYPNISTKTVTYTKALQHNVRRGLYYVIIKDSFSHVSGGILLRNEMENELTVDEKLTIKSYSELKSDNAIIPNVII